MIVNKEIFSFTRTSNGNKNYAVLMNLSNRTLNLDLSETKRIPNEAKISYVFGADPQETKELRDFYPKDQTISTKRILLNSNSCIIIYF